MDNLYNLLVICGELLLILIVFIILDSIIKITFKQSNKIPWINNRQEYIIPIKKILNRILVFGWFTLSLTILAINGFLIFKEKSLLEYTLHVIQNLPDQLWKQILFGLLKTSSFIIVISTLLRYLHPLIQMASEKIKNFTMLTPVNSKIDHFFQGLETHITNSLWLSVFFLSLHFLGLPEVFLKYSFILLVIYLIVFLSILVLQATTIVLESLDYFMESFFEPGTLINRYYLNLKHLIPFCKRCLEAVIYINMVTQIMGLIQAVTGLVNLGSKLVNLIGIILLSRVLIELTKAIIAELMLSDDNLSEIDQQRRRTITPLLQSLSKYLIYFGAGIWVLDIFQIDPTPILAAAGLLGLAVGLGAQNLINDMVSGFFILFENYYLVGDFIETGEAEGVVESIELRTTRIRHPNGQVYIIRNGNIDEVVNYSKEYIYAVVDIPISYEEDLKRVYHVITEVGKELQENYHEVLGPIDLDGVEEFNPSYILIRTLTKLKPTSSRRGAHDDIQGVLGEMLKEAFDREGIRPPFPHHIVHRREEHYSVKNENS